MCYKDSDLAGLETEGSQHKGQDGRWTGIYYESTYTLLCFWPSNLKKKQTKTKQNKKVILKKGPPGFDISKTKINSLLKINSGTLWGSLRSIWKFSSRRESIKRVCNQYTWSPTPLESNTYGLDCWGAIWTHSNFLPETNLSKFWGKSLAGGCYLGPWVQ